MTWPCQWGRVGACCDAALSVARMGTWGCVALLVVECGATRAAGSLVRVPAVAWARGLQGTNRGGADRDDASACLFAGGDLLADGFIQLHDFPMHLMVLHIGHPHWLKGARPRYAE